MLSFSFLFSVSEASRLLSFCPHFVPGLLSRKSNCFSSSPCTNSANRLRSMAVTTCLTWTQEKRLQNYFGGKQFSLLYKATCQGFYHHGLFDKCYDQGPALIVVYSGDHVIGAYMPVGLKNERVPIIAFALQETEISECKIGSHFFSNSCRNIGPSEFNIDLSNKKVNMHAETIKKLGLPQCNAISIEECEAFRLEDILSERRMKYVTELRKQLLSEIRTYKPYGNLVHQARILLLGPTGAGKSSFINSVKSIFRGHVTQQVLVGSDPGGTSKKYRTYSIKDGEDGNLLPFMLCDSLGLGEEGEGLCTDDIVSILKGHIPDRYQFIPTKPIAPGHGDYINNPSLKDRIHCVAFVLDAKSVEHLSHEMTAKIKQIRSDMIKYGVVHLALLTNVDNLDLITENDLVDIQKCVPVKSKVQAVHRVLGFALSDILVVSNYSSTWELDSVRDVLILSVLREMLWAADDYLEDLPCEFVEI
ncbi:interferon-induced protein 44 [Talpa occidentalis]|uniref:interferon-induced protein 44 n=1 Tax=Talpa occidentalis TaxID=50954 RepID=UPI00188E1A9D|nr:interferon-induced protein 44 [Talpa occidentalis]XP_054547340.1 interferon-induced protein 44 [Talpa occidentalis]